MQALPRLVRGVAVAHAREQPARGEHRGEVLGPLVRRRRVAGRADDQDRRGALGVDLVRLVGRRHRPDGARHVAPREVRAEDRRRLLEPATRRPAGCRPSSGPARSRQFTAYDASSWLEEYVPSALRSEYASAMSSSVDAVAARRLGERGAQRRPSVGAVVQRVEQAEHHQRLGDLAPAAARQRVRVGVRDQPGDLVARASATVGPTAQSERLTQSARNAVSARSNPPSWPSEICDGVSVGSTAPSSTRRPTFVGNSSAYVAPRKVPYDAPK